MTGDHIIKQAQQQFLYSTLIIVLLRIKFYILMLSKGLAEFNLK